MVLGQGAKDKNQAQLVIRSLVLRRDKKSYSVFGLVKTSPLYVSNYGRVTLYEVFLGGS